MSNPQNPFQERIDPVLEEIDTGIEAAKTQIDGLEHLRDDLVEILHHAEHFDSVACGVLEHLEEEQAIRLSISHYTLDTRVREVIEEYEWDDTTVSWIEQAGLFQVEMTMEYEL